jgi:hypothetical protein
MVYGVAYVNFDDKWSYDTVKDDVEVTTNPRVYVVESRGIMALNMYQTMYEYNVFLSLPNKKLITFDPSFIT